MYATVEYESYRSNKSLSDYIEDPLLKWKHMPGTIHVAKNLCLYISCVSGVNIFFYMVIVSNCPLNFYLFTDSLV